MRKKDRCAAGCPTQDEMQADIESRIASGSFLVIGVGHGDDTPSFTYTVGFAHAYAHPEIVIVGLPPQTAHHLLHTVKDLLVAGKKFSDGEACHEIIRNHPVIFRELESEIADETLVFASANKPSASEWRVLQMTVPDKNGLFPWDKGVNESFLYTQGWLLKPGATAVH